MSNATIKLNDADHYNRDELEELSVDELRQLYRSYMRAARYGITKEDIDDQLAKRNPQTPVEHVLDQLQGFVTNVMVVGFITGVRVLTVK